MRLGPPLSGRTDLPILGFAGDLPCAWCRLTWHRLRAVALECRVEICWLPFQLDPTVPAHGTPFRPWLVQRHGGSCAADAGLRRIQAAAAADKIEFDMTAIRKQPNSSAAHRLVIAAARSGQGIAAVDLLFEWFFEAGRDIGDHAVLDELAHRLAIGRWDDQEVPLIPVPISSVGAVPVIVDAAGDALVGCQPKESIAIFAQLVSGRGRSCPIHDSQAAQPVQGVQAS